MMVRGLAALLAFALVQGAPAAAPPKAAAPAALPDWSGVWSPGIGFGVRVPQPKPVLTPAAQKMVADFEAAKARGENLQTQAANCVPSGVPNIMRQPYPVEFLLTPGRVTILIETYSQIRRIYTDGRKLPEDPDLWFNGHSVGHWEGDTLVAETIGINPRVTLIDGIKATENTRITERIRRVSPTRMSDEITITDPALFAQPFTTTALFTLKPDWEMREYICDENNKDAADPFGRPSMSLGEE